MDLQEAFDAGFEAVKSYVDAEITSLALRIKAIEDTPLPAAGKDGRDGVDGKDGPRGEAGANGQPGADGRDGKDGEPGAPGKAGQDGKDGADGRDGVGLASAIQSKDGHLILTMTSGATVDVGKVAGQDGRDGVDGAAGRDGADGLGFDDMVAEYDGQRCVSLRFVRGDQAKEFKFNLPIVIDRGVWVEGKDYQTGDAVTWAGSLWIAQKDAMTDKPDGGDGWRLAVKRGRDGRPGKDGELKAHQPVRVS